MYVHRLYIINGIIQGIVSIIELFIFIVFYIDKITTLKWPEWPLLKWPVHSAIFSVHKIWPSPCQKINKMNLLEIIRPMIMVISNNFKTQQMCSEAVEKDPTLLAFYPCISQDEKKETGCGSNMLMWPGEVIRWSFPVHKIFKKFFKNVSIKDKFIFEKYNFKIIQRSISTRRSNTKCTFRKTAEHTWNCFFIV